MNAPGPCSVPGFSPQGFFSQVPAAAVQAEIRRQLRLWGLPGCIRVDNGYPWGNWNDLPTALPLWLYGLEVAMHWNDPRHPEQNGKVERSQGTAARWAEPWRCGDTEELQARFEHEDRIQREVYPAVGGRHSRLDVWPELARPRRCYRVGWERTHWDLAAALGHLASYQAVRKVSRSGHIAVYKQNYYVGGQHAGEVVYVQLDPNAVAWVISDENGCQLRVHAAKQISRARILALDLEA
jgi:hypothetical protein